MPVGDTADFVERLRLNLPRRWFPDAAPSLAALLTGLASVWSQIYALLLNAKTQTRLQTVNGGFLDLAAADYRYVNFVRRQNESDAAFRNRLLPIFRDKVTRAALTARLQALTGNIPRIFEPTRPADTGGYGIAMGYGLAGGYGSLLLPYQCFVQVGRPAGAGIPLVGGWGSPVGGWGIGAIEWGSLAQETPHVTDEDIYAAIADTIPAGTVAWVALGGLPISVSVTPDGTHLLGLDGAILMGPDGSQLLGNTGPVHLTGADGARLMGSDGALLLGTSF